LPTSKANDHSRQLAVHKGPVLAVMILGAFVAILNQTLLNVAIPHLMNTFNVSADTVQWLSTGYMLTNGVLIPITAFLIGTFTTRQLFIASMTSFLAGSLICALAPSFSILMVGRIVQAAGAGVIMPLMMTVILNLYPPETRGKAMGTIAIAMFFAPAVGPTLSGWMIEHYSWRWLFMVVVPIAAVDIIMAILILKNVTERHRPKFDVGGFVTSTIGFASLLYGFSEAGSKGWGDDVVRASIGIGIVFVVLFVIQEFRSKNPMLDLSVFKYSMFSLSTIVGCVVNMAMFGAMILVPIYLQNIRGFTPLESGMLLLPGAVLMGVMAPISGALFDKFGVRPMAIIGLSITAVTTWYFSRLTSATTYGHIMLLYTLRMFGMSFIAMTIMTAGLNQLPRRLNSHGTAASNTARQVAASLGTAFLVSVMTTRSHVHYADFTNIMTSTNPYLSQTLQQMGAGLAIHIGQPAQVGQHMMTLLLYGVVMKQSTIEGINDAFIVATVLTVIALILSFFLKRVRPEGHPSPRSTLPVPAGRKDIVPASES
jgi:EmrB/QacA subfamily drug resistance transporter